MSFAALMVHVDVERDSEQRVQLALGLANRFRSTLIGVAGFALRPAFAAGAIVVYSEPTRQDFENMTARLKEMGKKFCAQGESLKQIEWRTHLKCPSNSYRARQERRIPSSSERGAKVPTCKTSLTRRRPAARGTARPGGARHRPSVRASPRGRGMEGHA